MCSFKSLHFDFSLYSLFLSVMVLQVDFSAKASTRIKF